MERSALIAVLVVAGSFAAMLLARRLLFGILQRFAARTETEVDDLLILALKGPSLFLVVACTLYIAVRLADLPADWVALATRGMHLLVLLTVTVAAANVSGRLTAYFLGRVDLPIAVNSLLLAVIRAVVYAVGLLVILNFLGISITPIITALGVGGLAMALALQDTLSNLFAGIHLMAEQTVRVGDFVRLESGQEGFVEDISWRTTRIRMVQNNMVIVPNNKLSQSVITNYHLPDRTMMLPLPVQVAYGSDTGRVMQALREVAERAAAEVPGLLAEPAPQVQFRPGFGESALGFTLLCAIREATDQNAVAHELNTRILHRFGQEGIEFPFPTRTVYLRDERRRP